MESDFKALVSEIQTILIAKANTKDLHDIVGVLVRNGTRISSLDLFSAYRSQK